MGFEMNSVVDLGHVASLDLTPQRQRDQAAKAAAASSITAPPRATAKLVETKVTTTTFNDTTKVSEKVPGTNAPKPSQVTAAAAPSGGGRSLYSLIKKQATGSGSPFASPAKSKLFPAPDVGSRALPAPVNDSYDEMEDSFETDLPQSTSSTESQGEEKRTSQSSLQSQSSDYRYLAPSHTPLYTFKTYLKCRWI